MKEVILFRQSQELVTLSSEQKQVTAMRSSPKQTNLTTQTRTAHKTPQAIMEVPKTPAQTRVLSVSYFDLIGRLIAPMRAESSTQFEETFHG